MSLTIAEINKIKKDFPILSRQVNGMPLVYLDNAATSQKPQSVLDSLVDYYQNHNANVHRGLHTLSEEASEAYEQARRKVAGFIGAPHAEEVIFTKGATEGLNRVAFEWALENLHEDDEILTTQMEHHSNLVPWQVVAARTGAKLVFLEIGLDGKLDLAQAKEKIGAKTKLVAVTHASNVMGTVTPIKELAKLAKQVGAVVAVDGAQAVPHLPVNVASLGVDFYAFSGHKMLGPMGIGVLWGKRELLEKLPPYEYGGGMIDEVGFESATWAKLPEKFEAGTPPVSGAIGLAAAIDYLQKVGMENIREHEIDLNRAALEILAEIPQVQILGPTNPQERTGLISFVINGVHAHDVAAVLNTQGIAVRSGHHCCMPLHRHLQIPASVRASYYLYNTREDLEKLAEGVKKALQILG